MVHGGDVYSGGTAGAGAPVGVPPPAVAAFPRGVAGAGQLQHRRDSIYSLGIAGCCIYEAVERVRSSSGCVMCPLSEIVGGVLC